jgi:hypothetical protein
MKKIVMMLVIVVICNGNVWANLIYDNNFESIVGTEWSNNITDITPTGRRFLGHFFNDSHVYLQLNNLPAHNEITISFDLFIIKSWDGNSGPDIWGLRESIGQTFILTSFRNPLSTGGEQHYPNNIDGSLNPSQTGDSEIDTLGFSSSFGDSIYQLTFTFNHTESNISFEFFADGYTGGPLSYGIADESWGLDNVQVAVIPEPGTILLISLGSLILRKRK